MAANDPAPSESLPARRPAFAVREGPGQRGRHGHELAAAQADAIELVRLRRRAERAEAALADCRRDAARAIRGLQAQVTFWRLRAHGRSAAEAAAEAGLVVDEAGQE